MCVLLARSQYSEGRKVLRPASSTQVFLGFPGLKANAEVIPNFPSASTCFSCSPPELNLVVINVVFCIHVK
jgi:hypothetical protein